jgi:hypothetical protein
MITHDARRSLPHGNNPVPSPWLATRLRTMTSDGLRLMLLAVQFDRACCWRRLYLATEGAFRQRKLMTRSRSPFCRLGARFPVSAGQGMTNNWPAE